jgi:hypothetical protein
MCTQKLTGIPSDEYNLGLNVQLLFLFLFFFFCVGCAMLDSLKLSN